MTTAASVRPSAPGNPLGTGIHSAASSTVDEVLGGLAVDADRGLDRPEVERRQARWGRNAVATHQARVLPVLWHQLRSPLLGLLLVAAAASYAAGERSAAVIIAVIVGLSVGLGFVNEYRAERAAQALHSSITHEVVVVRDGQPVAVDVTTLVPGDLSSCSSAGSSRPIFGSSRSRVWSATSRY